MYSEAYKRYSDPFLKNYVSPCMAFQFRSGRIHLHKTGDSRINNMLFTSRLAESERCSASQALTS
jgi:hypothetical protein